jgi:benzylsuccinate CoA-transferase BbsF subunit
MNVTLQACSGLMLATGAEGDPPIGISNSWNDYIGGMHAAVAILGALSKRKASGIGCHLDVSQFESSVAMVGSLLLASAVTQAPPARLGSRSRSAAPQGCYRCAGEDRWCAISVQTDGEWQALVAELGDGAQHLHEPRFATLSGRLEHHDEIDRTIESWTGPQSPAEIERRLQRCGVPAAAMRRGNDVTETEEWQRLLRPVGTSDMQVLGLPFGFPGSAPVEAVGAPRIGANGSEILRDWLKLDDPAIAALLPEVSA